MFIGRMVSQTTSALCDRRAVLPSRHQRRNRGRCTGRRGIERHRDIAFATARRHRSGTPSTYVTLAIQLRARRSSRDWVSSSPKLAEVRRIIDGSTSSNALTLTTAYRCPSIRLVMTGTTPQRAHVWKSAVPVPKAYLETCDGSRTRTFSAPLGCDVQTPPCFVQNEQSQARAGISSGSGCQSNEKAMFPQWHLPWINMRVGPSLR